MASEQSEQLVLQMDSDKDGNISRFEFTQLFLDVSDCSGAYKFDEYMHETQSRVSSVEVQCQIANSGAGRRLDGIVTLCIVQQQ